MKRATGLLSLLVVAGCAEGSLSNQPAGGDTRGGGDSASASGDNTGASGDTALAAGDATGSDSAGPDTDVTGGGDTSPGNRAGTILLQEGFDDANLSGRGWYDGPSGTISTTEKHSGAGSFQCTFNQSATGCAGGMPARVHITPSTSVYVSFWIKYSSNWVGSGLAYHPHMMHFTTDVDTDYIGPAGTHLTTYIESPQGRPMLALQDALNVDPNCVLRNNDTFVGCSGNFSTYTFTEMRSVASCNGLMGFVDERDCFSTGTNTWYSSRAWRSPNPMFTDTPGPTYKGDWHFVEAYFELNSIQGGVGVADGRIRYYFDGTLLISSDNILMRTNQHPSMHFDHFLILPYIGDGSPVQQSFWLDELTVGTGNF